MTFRPSPGKDSPQRVGDDPQARCFRWKTALRRRLVVTEAGERQQGKVSSAAVTGLQSARNSSRAVASRNALLGPRCCHARPARSSVDVKLSRFRTEPASTAVCLAENRELWFPLIAGGLVVFCG